MKEICKKISNVLKTIFGYGIMITLFAGGLTFFVYVVALIFGGAQVNGIYNNAKKAATIYNYDDTNYSLVATVQDESFSFGNETNEDFASIGTITNKENGIYANFYAIDRDGKYTIIETPKTDTAYKFGISNKENEISFLSGEMIEFRMSTTNDSAGAIDVYLEEVEKGKGSYRFYTKVTDDEGKDKNQYININYSGGRGYEICDFIYKSIIPIIIYTSVIMVLLGLVAMYLAGEVALTPEKKKAKKHEGEV